MAVVGKHLVGVGRGAGAHRQKRHVYLLCAVTNTYKR